MTASDAPRKVPSPLRGKAREDAIIRAVIELIGEVGYERMTVDQIAARATASKATMYRRWPGGKAELVAETLRRYAERRELPAGATGSVRGDLLAAVEGITATVEGSAGGPPLIGLVECFRDDAVLRELVAGQIEGACEKIGSSIVASAAGRGERLDPVRAPTVLRMAIGEVLFRMLMTGAAPDAAEQRRIVDELLLPLMTGGGRTAT